jgi:hypothetical protein
MDIKHPPHKHLDKTEHKTIRVYSRKRVNRFCNYVPVGMMCVSCGQVMLDIE